ncbi:MAG TPA: sulfatase-like hydrolase/transferase [Actinomycetes bacterium]
MEQEAPADRRERLWAFLELFALVGFAVAQPTLDVLGKAPDFFLFRQAGRGEILILVLAVTVLPALGLWLAEQVVGLAGERARRLVHLAMVTGLLAVIALEVGKNLTSVRGPALVAIGVLGGLAGGLAYANWPGLKLWLRYLAPAPLVFALVFLLISPVSKLVLPQPGGTVDANAPGVRIKPEHPVVMMLLDEFPMTSLLDAKGQVDARLYPNFAKLAGQSTWYRNATAVSGLTQWAVPAMLSGRYPTKAEAEASPTAAQYPDNLFTLLGRSYPIEQQQVVTQLCPADVCKATKDSGPSGAGLKTTLRDSARVFKRIVWPRDADENPTGAWLTADPEADAKPAVAPGDSPILKEIERGNEPRQYYNFVRSIEGTDSPTFYFLHILLPHQPWHYLPDGRKYTDRGDGRNANGWTSEPWPPAQSRQRHLMQLGETDRLIGQVMRRLQEQGMYDKTLFIVTADHGMSFKPKEFGRRVATPGNVDQVLWVPLFIKTPGQSEGQVTDRNWEHVDLVPTVADLLGIKVPWEMDGVSQAGAEEPRTRKEKWFFSKPGERQVFPGPENQAKALHGVTDELLKPADGYKGWFEFGPHSDLVGRRASQVGIEPASAGSAKVEKLSDYAKVDPGSGLVPAQVAGQVSLAAGVPSRPEVAVALNGVIAGVSETFREVRDAQGSQPEGPPDKFSAMALDTLFKKGDNRLELFVIDDSGGKLRLRPLTVS